MWHFIILVSFIFLSVAQSYIGQSSLSWTVLESWDHEDSETDVGCWKRPHGGGDIGHWSKRKFILGHTVYILSVQTIND